MSDNHYQFYTVNWLLQYVQVNPVKILTIDNINVKCEYHLKTGECNNRAAIW